MKSSKDLMPCPWRYVVLYQMYTWLQVATVVASAHPHITHMQNASNLSQIKGKNGNTVTNDVSIQDSILLFFRHGTFMTSLSFFAVIKFEPAAVYNKNERFGCMHFFLYTKPKRIYCILLHQLQREWIYIFSWDNAFIFCKVKCRYAQQTKSNLMWCFLWNFDKYCILDKDLLKIDLFRCIS